MVRISQGSGSIQAVFADPRLSWRWLAMSTNGFVWGEPANHANWRE
ncbi:hypothetical protein PLANPX_1480 [Lacipirellula parvula]|uniref:Uncharacterized protein n=1 Tax=Lacipirellula parvula TaxID=2650471 RepID=A0A5K7X5U6_9BACT|nr:hypothetical protein PLANPX_1480 [Lacipirellula parvula]